MRVVGIELLKGRQAKYEGLKFIVNDAAIVFFPSTQQHRDVKAQGLSYEDDYRGNALAGLITAERVEIRFHRAFSDEHVKNLWSRAMTIPEIAKAGLGRLYYQGREIKASALD